MGFHYPAAWLVHESYSISRSICSVNKGLRALLHSMEPIHPIVYGLKTDHPEQSESLIHLRIICQTGLLDFDVV